MRDNDTTCNPKSDSAPATCPNPVVRDAAQEVANHSAHDPGFRVGDDDEGRDPIWDLSKFSLADMVGVGARLRTMGTDCLSLEELAQRVVDFLYRSLSAPDGAPGLVLARFFKAHPFAGLPPDLQSKVRTFLGNPLPALSLQCLTLLGTRGIQEDWNSRHTSAGHQAIPLASAATIRGIPMLAELTRQLGLAPSEITEPSPELFDEYARRTFSIFHVENARGSAFVPAQDEFVIPFGVASVIGVGGVLTSGEMFTMILFSRCHIAKTVVPLFKPLALNLRAAALQLEERVFK